MPGVWATVTNSQVFNWIKLIDQKGINTDCVSITNTKLSDDAVAKIEDDLGAKFYQISSFPYLIGDIYLFIYFLYLYLKSVIKYDKIIFQTRLPKIGIPFILIGTLYKVKIIYEARGAITEERIHVSRNRQDKKLKFKFKTAYINLNEKLFIKLSDKVICVSNTLKKYYKKKYNLLNSKKFSVFPGAADNSLFYFDSNQNARVRKELKFTDKDIVIIYSGKLKKDWEIPDDVFNYMAKLMLHDKNIRFLVVTPDLETANFYSNKYNLTEKTVVLKSKFEEVNKYLNAADISLMLREDVLMNNVASPTKFSEYILSGIPCIMSNGVYDFAQIIKETGFGVVLSDYSKLKKEEYNQIIKLLQIDRETISLWGRNNLSKENLISKYFELLKHV